MADQEIPILQEQTRVQTKSSLWAGATIWANLAIVFIIYVVLLFSLRFVPIPFLSSALGLLNPIILEILTVFSIWLGVHSVLKATPIDPQKVFTISIFSIVLPVLLQVGVLVLASSYGGYGGFGTWTLITYFLFPDLVIFSWAFYFLKKAAVGHSNPMLSTIIVGVAVLLSIITAYANYSSQSYLSSSYTPAQNVPSNQPNGETQVTKSTVYKNLALGFEITLPSGWYLPSSDATTTIFYDCPTTNCNDQFQISPAATLLYNNYSDYYNALLQMGNEEIASNQVMAQDELLGLIPNAGVIRVTNIPQPFSWQAYDYTVVFKNNDGSFTPFAVQAESIGIEDSILPSLKSLPSNQAGSNVLH